MTDQRDCLLDLSTVAARTGLSLGTVRKWASMRRLPTVKLGRRVLIAESDLNAWVDSHRKPADPRVAV